ncbi:MAG: AAA family ATPase, partial [Planctomycetes bacterium]|nr:AAA family ATPase [Planctomycetota bacterium]
MKIHKLDLIAFGPFTNLALPLDAGNFGLHLVYGPNEAGKTSALRALRQLFYGIPHNSGDNFVHRYADMRIGGKLEPSEGDPLECIRRKGAKHTLRDREDHEPIEPGRLSQFLGGIDEETFERRFGLSHKELISGGEDIVKGKGDLGDILFSAGAGVGNLRQLRIDLTAEAEALFKPTGRLPKINDTISKYKQARKQITEAQLTSAEWEQHDRSYHQAVKKLAETSRELLEKGAEKRRLERISEALPYVAERTRLRGELVELKDAIVLSDGFAERRREAVTRLTALEETHK